MANEDYTKLSDEELENLIKHHGNQPVSQNQASNEEPGFWSNLGHGLVNYEKGYLKGVGQSIGDVGASAINWPIQGIEYLTGKELPHVPHPHLTDNPGSLSESVGQNIGELLGGFALPGGAGIKTAQLANKGYKAMQAGKQLPLIGRMFAAGAGGAAEGALGNENNRPLGAVVGGLTGGTIPAISSLMNFSRSVKSKNIAKDIKNTFETFEKNFEQRFTPSLVAGEEAGANQFLKAQNANLKILKKAGGIDKKTGTKDLVYALEEYNKKPTLQNAHYAQRDLNKLANIHKNAPLGTAENKAYKEALKIKNRLLTEISDAFSKSGAKEHGQNYGQARIDYATEFGPYLKSKAIANLLGRNEAKTLSLRPEKFADQLLQEENFLAQAGKKHPGLLRREKYNALKSNPIAKGVALGGAALATPFLPYAVSKALGLK